MEKMKIEVWSDVMCPFCYIGKRRLEQSLANSPYKDQVQVEWKSYQLAPDLVTDTSISIDEYLSIHKGMSVSQAQQMGAQVTQMAAQEGLAYNFERAVVANTFRAHVLAHYAKKYGVQDEAEELLFQSYFTDGKNIDDVDVLVELAHALGLDREDFEKSLEEQQLHDEVKMDIHEAKQLEIRGVPFFVYNRKYAVSGAQPLDLFVQTLKKSVTEYRASQSPFILDTSTDDDASSCGTDGCK